MPDYEVPANMRALVLRDFAWTPDSLQVAQLPTPKPGPGQVLVRIAASPVNPSDLSFLRGRSGRPDSLPTVPGLEGSGRVVAAGAGIVGRLLVGRRVACAAPATAGGTWAEFMATSAFRCIPLRKQVSVESGASLIVNPMTAAAFIKIARRGGHRALVNTAAASALGRMISRLADREGILVIEIVRSEKNAVLLLSGGARHVLNSVDPDFDKLLKQRVVDVRATLALDAIAGPMTGQLLEALLPGGTVLVYGNLSQSDSLVPPSALIRVKKRLAGFYLSDWLAKEGPIRSFLLALRVQSQLDEALRTRIRARIPLEDAYHGISDYIQSMGAGKFLILPGLSNATRQGPAVSLE